MRWRPPVSASASVDAFVRALHGFLGCLETEALTQRTAAVKAAVAAPAPARRRGGKSGSGGARMGAEPRRARARPVSATQLMLAALPGAAKGAASVPMDVQERFRGAALTAPGLLQPCSSAPEMYAGVLDSTAGKKQEHEGFT